MKTIAISRFLLLIGILTLLIAVWHIGHEQIALPREATLKTSDFGDVAVARPDSPVNGLSVVFSDSLQFAPADLARRIAATGSAVAVVDSTRALEALSASCPSFLDGTAIADPLNRLADWAHVDHDAKRVIAGIGDGGFLAFLASQGAAIDNTDYLSVGFSAKPPDMIELCPPFAVDKQKHVLQPLSIVPSKAHWRAVWTDQPPDETGIFVRSIPNADTSIAPYDTPLDLVAIDEIAALLGQSGLRAQPMPIVEVTASHPKPILTLFYSGDGGWRDLDREVAKEMAKAGFSVAGVDVLRYFWERKSPQQAALDLANTMAHYRKELGVQSFVLAGYSFGADILPAVFNRLPPADRDAVKLLVLLAAGEQANFEIHVAGWLGDKGGEWPLAPEVSRIPSGKLFCVYGEEEKNQQGCKGLENSAAELLELPGGHHFDQDYPKLAQRILEVYRHHGLE